MMTPEQFGQIMFCAVRNNEIIDSKLDALVKQLFDLDLYNLVIHLRTVIEADLSISFEDGDKHYEFAMTFESEMRKYLSKLLSERIACAMGPSKHITK